MLRTYCLYTNVHMHAVLLNTSTYAYTKGGPTITVQRVQRAQLLPLSRLVWTEVVCAPRVHARWQ